MRTRQLVYLVPLAALVAGCSAAPASPPAETEPAAPATCDEAVFSDNVDADLTATATALDELPFPLDGVQAAGLNLVCTAHLSVDYEGGQTVEFDILVTDASLDDTAGALDDVAAEQDWVRDADNSIWRAPDDQNHFAQAMAIDEGVLVGTTEAG